jgi:hypothetical protein
MLHGFDFLTPKAQGRVTETRFETFVISPYCPVKDLEGNFFGFGRHIWQ